MPLFQIRFRGLIFNKFIPKLMSDKEDSWFKTDGTRIACKEKIKVLTENRQEITTLLQDALDDAILMGCSEKSFKDVYMEILSSLKASYPEQK